MVPLVLAALIRCTPIATPSPPLPHDSLAGFGEAPPPRPKPPPAADPELHVDTLLIEEIDAQGDVVRALWVGETEVLMLYYSVCVGMGACTRADRGIDCVHRSSRLDAPINCVSWAEADAYCRSHGERLPTEEEWDWIVRVEGGNPWGPDENPCDFAVLQDPEEGRGCGSEWVWPVKSKPRGRSRSGLYGLAGNVAEWTASAEGEGMHVVRGASWVSLHDEGAGVETRSVVRDDRPSRDIGFRCVSDQ